MSPCVNQFFTPERRDTVRREILEWASNNGRIISGAITGSAADAREDCWSDVDLAFGIRDAGDLSAVLYECNAYMYKRHLAVHHVDIMSCGWVNRAFVLPDTLQVDLAFISAGEFQSSASSFRLVFGETTETKDERDAQKTDFVGTALLQALNARACIARGRLWQAEYMVRGIRDNVLALACGRNGLPAFYGRGLDRLSADFREEFKKCFARDLTGHELSRVFSAVIQALIAEVRISEPALACGLEPILQRLPDRTEPDVNRED